MLPKYQYKNIKNIKRIAGGRSQCFTNGNLYPYNSSNCNVNVVNLTLISTELCKILKGEHNTTERFVGTRIKYNIEQKT